VQLPSSINNLVSLSYLELNSGIYNSLPANLSGLVNLQSITVKNVDSANATIAFAPFATLPNVKTLSITPIPLDTAWIWNMPTLTSLDLDDSLFPLRMDAIGSLVNLEKLSIRAAIQEFPPGMANLTRLKSLKLFRSSSSPLTFPTYFGNFTALESISLRLFNIPSGVLPDLAVFPNLTSFALQGINGMQIPPSLFEANKLETVTIESCSSLTSFPAISNAGLPNLKSVSLNALPVLSQAIPDGFYNSLSMEDFSLSNMPILNQPMSSLMGQWINLESLNIENVPLTGPVPNIFNFRNLTRLVLSSMAIEGPLVSTAGLPNLEILTVTDTRVSDLILNVTAVQKLQKLCV
jgi:Leucine-rich repeat (LRR) protein